MGMVSRERRNLAVDVNGHGFAENWFKLLEKFSVEKVYPAGATIYMEGDIGENLYFIKNGTVKLTKTSDDGTALTFNYFYPNDVFGEFDLIQNARYTFSTKAMTWVRLGAIRQKDLEWLIYHNGEFALNYTKWLSYRQKYTQLKLRDLLFHGKNGALASTLVRAANTYGVKEGEHLLITRKMTHNELAELIGATRETVNRMLSKLKKGGLIDYENGRISILDLQGLKAICHCEECPLEICRL